MTEKTDNETQRCEQYGRSTVPLDTVHVRRPCMECGRIVYLAEPGEGGRGIQVLAGDSLTIPGHMVRDMLDPRKALDPRKTTGKVFRSGIPIFMKMLYFEGLSTVNATSELHSVLEQYQEHTDQILRNSPLLTDLDIDDPEDAQSAIEIIRNNGEYVSLR